MRKTSWIPSRHLPVSQPLDGAGGGASIPAHGVRMGTSQLTGICACSDLWAIQRVGRASRSQCAHAAPAALLTSPSVLCHQHFKWAVNI